MTTREMPYSESDFRRLRDAGMYFVDKTAYIGSIENASDYAFYLRPHGFGKTLFVSMLECYYDINALEEFDSLFSGLQIAQHPTKARNSFLVLRLDLGPYGLIIQNLRQTFDALMREAFRSFCEKYSAYLPTDEVAQVDVERLSATEIIYSLATICENCRYKIFLLIDNYDGIADSVLKNGGLDRNDPDVDDGIQYYFQFFESIKAASSRALARMFATGTTPMLLRTLLSGFNIAKTYNTEFSVSSMMGFTEADLRRMLTISSISNRSRHSVDTLMEELKKSAGGFCFSPDCVAMPKMFSPRKALDTLRFYEDNGFPMPINAPTRNICPLLHIRDANYDKRTSQLKDPFGDSAIVVRVEDMIPVAEIAESRYFLSLLYYMGVYTIAGQKWGSMVLRTTNADAQRQIKYFLD